MKRLLFAFVTGLIMSAWSTPSSALFLSQGDSAVGNYDISGTLYSDVHIVIDFSGFDAGEALDRQLYSELDAMGTLLVDLSALDGPQTNLSIGYGNADVNDGVFSILFTALLGSLEIVDTYAYGCLNVAQTCYEPVDGELVSRASAPEPSTLTLLGFGLVGLALRRRRKWQVHADWLPQSRPGPAQPASVEDSRRSAEPGGHDMYVDQTMPEHAKG